MHPASATQDVTSSATQDASQVFGHARRTKQDGSQRHQPCKTSAHVIGHRGRQSTSSVTQDVPHTGRQSTSSITQDVLHKKSINVITNTKRQPSPSATQDVSPRQRVHQMSAATQEVSSRHQPHATSIHATSYARLQSTSLLLYTKCQSCH